MIKLRRIIEIELNGVKHNISEYDAKNLLKELKILFEEENPESNQQLDSEEMESIKKLLEKQSEEHDPIRDLKEGYPGYRIKPFWPHEKTMPGWPYETPVSPGLPGWHVTCSTISEKNDDGL